MKTFKDYLALIEGVPVPSNSSKSEPTKAKTSEITKDDPILPGVIEHNIRGWMNIVKETFSDDQNEVDQWAADLDEAEDGPDDATSSAATVSTSPSPTASSPSTTASAPSSSDSVKGTFGLTGPTTTSSSTPSVASSAPTTSNTTPSSATSTPASTASTTQSNSVPSGSYTVKAGDTLSSIAKSQTGDGSRSSYTNLAKQNGISNPDMIKPGQVINFGAPMPPSRPANVGTTTSAPAVPAAPSTTGSTSATPAASPSPTTSQAAPPVRNDAIGANDARHMPPSNPPDTIGANDARHVTPTPSTANPPQDTGRRGGGRGAGAYWPSSSSAPSSGTKGMKSFLGF